MCWLKLNLSGQCALGTKLISSILVCLKWNVTSGLIMWSFLSLYHQRGCSCTTGYSPRYRHNGASLAKDHKHDEGLAAWELCGCLKRLWSLQPWRYSKPGWTQPWVGSFRWPCFEQRGWTRQSPHVLFSCSGSVVFWQILKIQWNTGRSFLCVLFQWQGVRKHMCVYAHGSHKASNTLLLLKYHLILPGLFSALEKCQKPLSSMSNSHFCPTLVGNRD